MWANTERDNRELDCCTSTEAGRKLESARSSCAFFAEGTAAEKANGAEGGQKDRKGEMELRRSTRTRQKQYCCGRESSGSANLAGVTQALTLRRRTTLSFLKPQKINAHSRRGQRLSTPTSQPNTSTIGHSLPVNTPVNTACIYQHTFHIGRLRLPFPDADKAGANDQSKHRDRHEDSDGDGRGVYPPVVGVFVSLNGRSPPTPALHPREVAGQAIGQAVLEVDTCLPSSLSLTFPLTVRCGCY